jgi:hypothetical protein
MIRNMIDPNKVFGVHEKDFWAFYYIEWAQEKREKNSRKS